ncbi:MAG: HAMP domain-containing histidine kinase [Acidobacteriota bacterium]|nr:HAMP domain-containing histidine kinase [Acidobacteriota bacterium]
MSLRTRLALVFVAATLIPLGATVWLTTLLLNQSLRLSPADQISDLSRSLERTGQKYYQQVCNRLKTDALAGRAAPVAVANAKDLLSTEDSERCAVTGEAGDKLLYLARRPGGVTAWERPLDIPMQDLKRQYVAARRTVDALGVLRRGSFPAWILSAAAIWLVALTLVWLVATRFSRPIVKLTQALKTLADGDFKIRVPNERTDEIGLATEAFNRTAAQLEQSRDRLVSLTQVASWQVLARKTAHEVKNSLTPIRLTVEEMVARAHNPDRAFLEQAAGIVVDEIESLERRIRAFSEFSSEPPICPEQLDVHAIVEERIAFLQSAHPEVRYTVQAAESTPSAVADQDLVKGILLNLLENAAEAAGEGGRILARVRPMEDRIAIDVHDSGPGLSDLARRSLFQPTISFKKRGMGLGLSIARKSALLTGGDILLIAGELGGAGFRVLLPTVSKQA